MNSFRYLSRSVIASTVFWTVGAAYGGHVQPYGLVAFLMVWLVVHCNLRLAVPLWTSCLWGFAYLAWMSVFPGGVNDFWINGPAASALGSAVAWAWAPRAAAAAPNSR